LEIVPGVALALRIIVPASELDDLPPALGRAKDMYWLAPPPTGQMAVASVVFTSFEVSISEWPGCETGVQLLGRTGLADGRTMFFVYTYESSTDTDYYAAELPQAEIALAALSRGATRVLGIGVHSDGVGFLREFSILSFLELVPRDSPLGAALGRAHRNLVTRRYGTDEQHE